jgi:hypothetical protein
MNNKQILLGIIGAFLLSLSAYGQKPVMVEESRIKFDHGDYPGLILTIPEGNYSSIEKDWISILEQHTKSNVVIENGELSVFGANISDIFEAQINVFSKVTAADSVVILESVFELKPNEFISSDQSTKELAQAKKYLFEFGRDHYAAVAKEQLKAQEKTLDIIEKKLQDLYSNKTRLEKLIVDSKNGITQNEDKITMLKSDLITLNEQLNAEKSALALLKNQEAIDLKEKEIKSIEKNKKNAMDDITSSEKKIVDFNSAIESANVDITNNLSEQENVKYQLNEQKNTVQAAETKHNNIVNSNLNN